LNNKQDLVEFETNKYIHGTYHHKKYIDRYNMDRFIAILNNPTFKEHKDFNEITNSFPLSMELISNEIIYELEEKGFEKRLKVFVGDLTYILKEIKLVLPKFDSSSLDTYLTLAKRYIFSTTEKDLDLAKGHILNFLYKYQSIEKEIVSIIVSGLASLVENNYYFILAGFWYDDDEALDNRTEDKIYRLYSILYSILLSKNITKNGAYFWTIADINSRVTEGKSTAVFVRRKYLPSELKHEFSTLYEILYGIESNGGGKKVAEKYLSGWLENQNTNYQDYIINSFGGKKNIKQYMTSEVSDKELFSTDPSDMNIDDVLKFLKKKKKRFWGF